MGEFKIEMEAAWPPSPAQTLVSSSNSCPPPYLSLAFELSLLLQDPDTPKLIDSTDHWNQYATFPRDRRTSSASPADLSKSCLASATLDKGSDDIDYRHVSSPETTDNSASSLESAQTLRRQLLNIERAEQTVPSGRARKESGSDEEVFARTRSKSLTGREVFQKLSTINTM